jgi:hypothetical protein
MLFGSYETECGLFSTGSVRKSLMKCGVLNNDDPITRQNIMCILKNYVLNDLRFYPISARQFSKYIKAAFLALEDVLMKGVLDNLNVSFSDMVLKDEASELLMAKEMQRKLNIVRSLCDDDALSHLLPTNLADVDFEHPAIWRPIICPLPNVSEMAVKEQNSALNLCVHAIDMFLRPTDRYFKFPCLVGRPGSGKSYVLKLAVAYALSKGLRLEVLSWTSERARQLGGNHLHIVFPFGVFNDYTTSANSLACSCLGNLNKDPLKKLLLIRTDIFVFEEIGMLSAEYFVAIDNILRALMGNSLPWGGKLLMCCGDYKQLPPIDGRPLWASLNMCTMMDVFVFAVDVRTRDPCLSWLNSECRRQLNKAECEGVYSSS